VECLFFSSIRARFSELFSITVMAALFDYKREDEDCVSIARPLPRPRAREAGAFLHFPDKTAAAPP
jgi:hypothetical protein